VIHGRAAVILYWCEFAASVFGSTEKSLLNSGLERMARRSLLQLENIPARAELSFVERKSSPISGEVLEICEMTDSHSRISENR
jgi:hypothetical protein